MRLRHLHLTSSRCHGALRLVRPWLCAAVPVAALLSACGGGEPETPSDAAATTDHRVQALSVRSAPSGATAGVRIATDNIYALYVNGVQVGAGTDWTVSTAFPVALNPGDVVAVDATDTGYKAGVIAEVTAGGNVYGSDAGWKVSTTAPAGWNNKGFDDGAWVAATDYGAVNAAPWGPVSGVAGLPTTSLAHWVWTATNPTGGTPTPRAYFRFIVPTTSTPTGFKRWSDPATWGGTVPAPGTAVVVPAGTSILLDQDIAPSTLTVNGALQCDARDLNLTSRWVMVMGKLQCGTATSPYVNRLTVTLTGAVSEENVSDLGTKFLGAMMGGSVDLYGATHALTWTQLAANAAVGATQITLRAAPGWAVGDQIVVASTVRDMNQAEVRTISAINGTTVTLGAALTYRHQGATESYGNANRTWVLDEGAEVGLLTHNIVVQGDTGSATTNFGGHTMFMAGSSVHFSNVMLSRMGQTGRIGRYPFHWHLAGDVTGQSITASSVVNSYNRAVTIHQTNSALVRDVVAYNILGHAFFLEDGSERFNVIDHNLGVVTVRPTPAQAILETDYRANFRGSDGGNFEFYSTASGPATFWISHAENTVTNNAAAGSDGTGFWFHTDGSPTGLSTGMALSPLNDPQATGKFDANRAHSSYMALGTCFDKSGFEGWRGKGTFSNFTAFQVDQGFWPCNNDIEDDTHGKTQTYRGFVTADVAIAGLFSPDPLYFTDSAFVGRSTGNPTPAVGYRGINLYDAGYSLTGIHFANYADTDGGAFGMVWGSLSRTSNRSSGMTRQNVSQLFYTGDMQPIGDVDRDLMGDMVNDLDGSLTGTAGAVMVTSHPMVNDSSTRPLASTVDAYVSTYRYGRLLMTTASGADYAPGTNGRFHTVTRSDGAKAASNVKCPRCVQPTNSLHMNTPVIVNGPYSYSHSFDNGIPETDFQLQLKWAKAGDTVVAVVTGANPVNTTVTTTGWTQVASAAAVTASTGHAWFVGQDGSLTLKLLASGADWFAIDKVAVQNMGTAVNAPAAAVACAGEGGVCALQTGTTATVYYGANGTFTSKGGLSGSVGCGVATFGLDPVPGVVKSCRYVADVAITAPVPGAVTCAADAGTCTLPAGATATVFYGGAGKYASRAGVSGSIACSAAGIGADPAPGAAKSCVAVVTVLPSSVAACGNDYASCTVPAGTTATVFYGQTGVYVYRTGLSGSFSCVPGTFGGDPLNGVQKTCRY